MQGLLKEFDELNISADKTITKQFEPDEKIILSTNIAKFNERNKKQDRTFLLTNKYLYNIKKTTIKRKIPASKIKAVTISNIGNEFVIHIPDEYDYRYLHSEKRDKIIDSLNDLHRKLHNRAHIAVQYKDDISLEKYVYKRGDKRERVFEDNNQPKEAKECKTIYSKNKDRTVALDDFSLLKVLGRGAFGKVMLVKLKETGELFALKSMKKAELVEKDQLEHTKVEKMILEKIDHPFLVGLEYCFQTKEKIFFVMHFMRGGELFQHLRKEKRFPESRAKFYGATIAMALGHLHSHHIIYRDMKPENILMDDDGYLALTDFGMAKVLADDMLANSFCGTPEYLAPEVITASGHGREADWWGLGILMYELLIGIPPFYHQNHNTMFQLIQTAEVKFHPQIKVSNEAKDFIVRCLKKNPKERLGSKDDLKELMSHPWFSDLDWKALYNKQIPAPFKPVFTSNTSTEYFDEEFTSEEPINSYTSAVNPEVLKEFDEQFQSVHYQNS